MQALREETINLRKPLATVRQTANDLAAEASEAGVGGGAQLQDEVEGLAERVDELQARLDDRCSQLQSAATALTQFYVSNNLLLYSHSYLCVASSQLSICAFCS